jgi:hypothetical protein
MRRRVAPWSREEVTAMRWRSEITLYLGAFALFAGVVLWAQDASPAVLAVFGAMFLLLLLVFVWQMVHTRRVLVVGSPSPSLGQVDATLEALGYDVRRCAGPANRPCPVFQGRPCPMSERPVAAIVFRDEGETGRYAPCGAAFGIPEVIVEDHLEGPPAEVGRMARIGFDHGPDAVIVTMERMLT